MYGKYQEIIKHAGKGDNQQQYKAIIEVEMVSTTDTFNENSPMPPGPYVTARNTSARKPLLLFTKVFMSKRKLLSAGWVLLNQSARK